MALAGGNAFANSVDIRGIACQRAPVSVDEFDAVAEAVVVGVAKHEAGSTHRTTVLITERIDLAFRHKWRLEGKRVAIVDAAEVHRGDRVVVYFKFPEGSPRSLQPTRARLFPQAEWDKAQRRCN